MEPFSLVLVQKKDSNEHAGYHWSYVQFFEIGLIIETNEHNKEQ